MQTGLFSLGDKSETRRASVLLVSTVVFIIILPFSGSIPLLSEAVHLTVVASAVLVAGTTRRTLWIAAVLGIATAVFQILARHTPGDSFVIAYFVINSLLFVYVAALMLGRIFTTRVVTRETIFLAIASYMLVGLVWSFAYIGLETFQPGSFSFAAHLEPEVFWTDLYYFSFVTMTTLGYGDITPVSQPARSLAILEAISGVMFLGVLIGRLIGAYEREPKR